MFGQILSEKIRTISDHLEKTQGVDIQDYQLMMEENLRSRKLQENFQKEEEVQSNTLINEEKKLVSLNQTLTFKNTDLKLVLKNLEEEKIRSLNFIEKYNLEIEELKEKNKELLDFLQQTEKQRDEYELRITELKKTRNDNFEFNHLKENHIKSEERKVEEKESLVNFLKIIFQKSNCQVQEAMEKLKRRSLPNGFGFGTSIGFESQLLERQDLHLSNSFSIFDKNRPSNSIIFSSFDQESCSLLVAGNDEVLRQIRVDRKSMDLKFSLAMTSPLICAEIIDKDETIFIVGKNSKVEFFRKGKSTRFEKLEFENTTALKKIKSGNFAALNQKGSLDIWDAKKFVSTQSLSIPGHEINILQSFQESIYLHSKSNSIFMYDPKSNMIEGSIQHQIFNSAEKLTIFDDFYIAVGNSSSVSVIDRRKWKIIKFFDVQKDEQNQNKNKFDCLSEKMLASRNQGLLNVFDISDVPHVYQTIDHEEGSVFDIFSIESIFSFFVVSENGKILELNENK